MVNQRKNIQQCAYILEQVKKGAVVGVIVPKEALSDWRTWWFNLPDPTWQKVFVVTDKMAIQHEDRVTVTIEI